MTRRVRRLLGITLGDGSLDIAELQANGNGAFRAHKGLGSECIQRAHPDHRLARSIGGREGNVMTVR